MANNTPEINTIINQAQPLNNPPDNLIPPSQKNNFPLIFIFMIITIVIAGLFYYLGMSGYKLALQKNPPDQNAKMIAPTSVATLLPTQVIEKSPPSSPSSTPTKKVVENLSSIPGSIVFSSETLGIRFRHAINLEKNNPDSTITTKVVDNKIYIFVGNTKPESGQYVEVLAKDKNDSFEEAINKQFLKNISSTDCFVKIVTDKKLPANFSKAIISYPIPTDADQPAFTYGEKCPDRYTAKNGIAYFLYDPSFPEKYLFLSIGQYAINAQNGIPDSLWQDTIQITK